MGQGAGIGARDLGLGVGGLAPARRARWWGTAPADAGGWAARAPPQPLSAPAAAAAAKGMQESCRCPPI